MTTHGSASATSTKTLCGRLLERVEAVGITGPGEVTCKQCLKVTTAATSKTLDEQPALSFQCPDCKRYFAADDLLQRHDCTAKPTGAHLLAKLLDRLRSPQELRPSSRSWYQTRDDRIDLDRVDTLQSIIDAAAVEQYRIVTELRQVRSTNSWSEERRASWDAIGEAIGISKQLARHRFEKAKRPAFRTSKDV